MAKTIALLLINLAFLASYSSAQKVENKSAKRVFLYNGLEFKFDTKKGIKKLVTAINYADSDCVFPAVIDEKARQKRYHAIIQPVVFEIENVIKQIELSNNIFLLDGAKLEEQNILLAFDEKLNISAVAANEINDFFDGEINTLMELESFSFRIVTIDTTKLKDFENNLPYFQKYLEEKKISLILDFGKQLPFELKIFQIDDVTKDFISYYNQINQ